MDYATEEFYKTQILSKDERILQLEEQLQRVTNRDYANAAALQTLRDAMHEWTLQAVESSEIAEGSAEEIAEICGFELTKEVDVQVTVEYGFTINVPLGQEVEDIVNNINFENIDYDTDTTSLYNASVESIDF